MGTKCWILSTSLPEIRIYSRFIKQNNRTITLVRNLPSSFCEFIARLNDSLLAGGVAGPNDFRIFVTKRREPKSRVRLKFKSIRAKIGM